MVLPSMRSTDRPLTSDAGSLPRVPDYLSEPVDIKYSCIYTLYMPADKYLDISQGGQDTEKCSYMVVACVCLNLRKASRIITQMYDDALKPSGLRSTQLPVLATLVSAGPMTVNSVAEELLMDRTSLSRLLRPLVTRGLIKMTPGQDRRTRELSITDRGREAVAAAIPMWDGVQDRVVERLGQNRWRNLSDNLSAAAALRS